MVHPKYTVLGGFLFAFNDTLAHLFNFIGVLNWWNVVPMNITYGTPTYEIIAGAYWLIATIMLLHATWALWAGNY